MNTSALLCLFVVAVVLGSGSAADASYNCSTNTKGATLTCFTCMGRDMTECDTGRVCCKGSCFKLIDEEHELIVKGCTEEEQEDGSMKRRELDVKLYWAEGEKVKGESYFCNKDDLCNSQTEPTITVPVVVATLFVALFR
ncbi:hypothetical protein L596_004828 [Steinernema carpocapsae]|uniref:UPAR/Ly6 domain-containing protein n=1 Tax=Steinernema carpocapsae TaxID=34508 RepID=A0A4U8UXA0_STECR|nr:hypothetical protein L596_004828 [Steinernema carpocapsae]